mgnify:CR=1 FL=1
MQNPSILNPESFLGFEANANLQQGNYHIDIPVLKEGEQYRFHFDATACIGCHSCEVACNEQNNNDSDVKWRRVGEMNTGTFPAMTQLFNSMSCNHCIDPECLKGCPTQSYIKFDNGIVFHDDDTCIGCQYCTWNCPYEVPVFNHDRGIVTKCHMCHDKLANNQTPACVQTCPGAAIEVETFNVQQWLTKDMYEQGIAPCLPDVNITKPTTRYTLPKMDENEEVIPADDFHIKPNHPEWPLIFMTVLTQISLGGFVALIGGEFLNFFGFNLALPNLFIILAIFLPAALGLPLSALHLGRPILALTAMKNYKTSWLSREAIALGIYTGGLSLLVLMYFLELSFGYKFFVELLVLPIGIYGIYAQSMIYRVKARPSWNKEATTKTFFGVGYIGFLLTSSCLSLMNEAPSANILITTLLFLSFYKIALLNKQTLFYKNLGNKHKNFYQLNKTKQLYEEFFSSQSKYRKLTLYIGSLALPILALLFNAQGDSTFAGYLLALAVIVSLISELIGRYLFYVTAVSQGLAGNFFVGSQR